MHALDLVGRKYGWLTVIRRDGSDNQHQSMWLCKCDCGKEKTVKGQCLKLGSTKSCGCWANIPEKRPRYRHGMCRSAEYAIWSVMKGRCENPNSQKYPSYGARGITVSSEFQTFDGFYAHMGPKPCGMSIERIDNDGPYSPENCRWATRQEQARNKRSTIRITHAGVTLPIQAWAERLGVPEGRLRTRHKLGWAPCDILTAPYAPGRKLQSKTNQNIE